MSGSDERCEGPSEESVSLSRLAPDLHGLYLYLAPAAVRLQSDDFERKAVAQKSRKGLAGVAVLEEVAGEIFSQPSDSHEEARSFECAPLGVDDGQESRRARVELVGEFFELHAGIDPGGYSHFPSDGEGVEVEDAPTGESTPRH